MCDKRLRSYDPRRKNRLLIAQHKSVSYNMNFGLYLIVLLFPLSLLLHHVHAEGVKSRCESPAMYMGDTGSVTCYFSVDLKQSSKSFRLYRYSIDPTDMRTRDELVVLDCYWHAGGTMQCSNPPSGYEFNGTASDQVRVTIPKVSPDFQGRYECRAEPSYPRDIKDCVFLIKSNPAGQTGDTGSDEGSNMKTVVGIAVGVCVVCALLAVIAILLLVCRKRVQDRLPCFRRPTQTFTIPVEETPFLVSHAKEQFTAGGLPEEHSTITDEHEDKRQDRHTKTEKDTDDANSGEIPCHKDIEPAAGSETAVNIKKSVEDSEIKTAVESDRTALEEERKQLNIRRVQLDEEKKQVEKEKLDVEKQKIAVEVERKALGDQMTKIDLERKAMEQERLEALRGQVPAVGDYRLLLVGKTGHGKSSSGNTILGAKKFPVSSGMSSGTATWQLERGECLGRTVEILDTPGPCNTELSAEEIVKEIARGVAEMSRGFHAVLYFVRCDMRYTQEEHDSYKLVKTLLGQGCTKHMIVVFTAADTCERSNYEELIKKYISNYASLVQVSKDCEGRHLPFSNKADEKTKAAQLEHLFSTIDKLLAQNGRKIYLPTLNVKEALK